MRRIEYGKLHFIASNDLSSPNYELVSSPQKTSAIDIHFCALKTKGTISQTRIEARKRAFGGLLSDWRAIGLGSLVLVVVVDFRVPAVRVLAMTLERIAATIRIV